MNGAQDGNLNIVREEFKKATITLLDGRKVPMDSAIGLEVLTSRIIQDGNLDAAIMFFEQLGLSENYIKAINSNEKLFDKAYKSVNRINNVYSSIDRQTKIINEEVKKLGDLNNDPDYLEKLDKMEENILNRCKNTGYRKSLSLVKPAIKDMKSTLAKNPNSNKLDVVKSFTEAIKAGSLLAAKKDTKAQSDLIEAYYTFLNFVTKIKLPLNSPCEKQRDEFLEKFSKWTEYVSNSRKKYSNINVATFVQ
jgi:cysteinyl-tRNA synthetase